MCWMLHAVLVIMLGCMIMLALPRMTGWCIASAAVCTLCVLCDAKCAWHLAYLQEGVIVADDVGRVQQGQNLRLTDALLLLLQGASQGLGVRHGWCYGKELPQQGAGLPQGQQESKCIGLKDTPRYVCKCLLSFLCR